MVRGALIGTALEMIEAEVAARCRGSRPPTAQTRGTVVTPLRFRLSNFASRNDRFPVSSRTRVASQSTA